MIDEIETFKAFGYKSFDWSNKSSKFIIARCDECNKTRRLRKFAYKPICGSCIKKAIHLSPATRKRLSRPGSLNPFWKRTHSRKSRRLMSAWRIHNGRKLPIDGAAKTKLIAAYRHNAASRGIQFQLNDKQLVDLFVKPCHYCGSPPSCTIRHGKNGIFIYNGIDRVNSQIGYHIKNCVSCCKTCNYAKRSMSYKEFLIWVKKVYIHLHTKRKAHVRTR